MLRVSVLASLPQGLTGMSPKGTRHQFPASHFFTPLAGPQLNVLKSRRDQQENKTLYRPPKKTPTQEPNGSGGVQCKMDLQLL